MSPNTALLHQTLTHIETHPDQWHQLDWATKTDCGTRAPSDTTVMRPGQPRRTR